MAEHVLNILSAEDDLDDQFLIKQAIEKSGIRASINFVCDGKSLLEKITSLPYYLLYFHGPCRNI